MKKYLFLLLSFIGCTDYDGETIQNITIQTKTFANTPIEGTKIKLEEDDDNYSFYGNGYDDGSSFFTISDVNGFATLKTFKPKFNYGISINKENYEPVFLKNFSNNFSNFEINLGTLTLFTQQEVSNMVNLSIIPQNSSGSSLNYIKLNGIYYSSIIDFSKEQTDFNTLYKVAKFQQIEIEYGYKTGNVSMMNTINVNIQDQDINQTITY